MPDLRLREVRLPELSLPEMSRDDIVRAIGEARRDIDLSGVELPKLDLPKLDLPKLDVSRIDLSKVDVAKAVTTATKAVGLMRRPRSRLPIVIAGVIAIAAVGFALVMSPTVKPRLAEAARRWRERMEARRAERLEEDASNEGPVAVPVEPAAFADIGPMATTTTPVATMATSDEAARV